MMLAYIMDHCFTIQKGKKRKGMTCTARRVKCITSEALRCGSHSFYTANTPHLPLPRKRTQDDAIHMITAGLHPKRARKQASKLIIFIACRSKWFVVNRLSIFVNVSKTNFVLFCNSRKRYDKCKIKIMFNGTVLEQVKHSKFLGVGPIDEHLSWDKHIHEVFSKVSRNVGILGKLKHSAPRTCYYKSI